MKNKQNSLKQIMIRNKYIYMSYKTILLLTLTSIICAIFSIIFFIYFIGEPAPPQYIPTNEKGGYIELEPLNQEKPPQEVQRYTIKAIKKLYTYDYVNYSNQFMEAAGFFSIQSWGIYLDSYIKSNTLAAVKANQWVVSVEIEDVPNIIKKELNNENVFEWVIDTKIKITYNGKKTLTQSGILRMKLSRESVINNSSGLIIKTINLIQKN